MTAFLIFTSELLPSSLAKGARSSSRRAEGGMCRFRVTAKSAGQMGHQVPLFVIFGSAARIMGGVVGYDKGE
jgi:hypothetical protein